MCKYTIIRDQPHHYQRSAPTIRIQPQEAKMFLTKKQWKKQENAMNKFSLNKTQCIQEGIHIKNIKNQNLASLYTKNCKIHIDKVNYIRDQPITLLTSPPNLINELYRIFLFPWRVDFRFFFYEIRIS